MTQSLLDFILSLLRDSDAKAAFLADPGRALADAGLSEVCSEDVADAMSYVSEYHPVSFVGERDYQVGNTAINQHASTHPEHWDGGGGGEHHDGPHGDGGPAGVVQRLEYITNNYAYTDSHDTVIDHSVNQSIWNHGTLVQSFEDRSVTATDHSVAAGHDLNGDTATGDHDVVGDHNSVGNTTQVDDHSRDESIHGSFNGNNLADHGSVAGDGAAGNVTEPDHSAVATNGSGLDTSTTDSHNTSVQETYTDSHDHTDNSHTHLDSHDDNSHPTLINSENHDNNNHESYNQDTAITHTHQEGLINANVSPAVNLPIHDNSLDLLSGA